jgi:choline monooxygenase
MPDFFVDPDISRARTLSTEFYTSPAYFESAKDKIFGQSWHLVPDQSDFPVKGSLYPFTILPDYLDEHLLMTRDAQGQIRCLSNVCTHRGNLLVEKPCQLANIRCRYHGRLFDLDGRFKSMPEFREVRDFPGPDDDLCNLPLFSWGNLQFTSLNPQSDPLRYFGDMINRVRWLPLESFRIRPELSRRYRVKANWALYCENYLEGFHIPFVHAGLNAVIDYGNYTTELFGWSNLQLGIAKNEELCFDLPADSPDRGKKVGAYYFWVFPNMMFNFYPWGLSLNLVKPIGLAETEVSFITYVWKDELFNTGAGSELDTVEMEDEEVVEAVQKGVRSRFYLHGRYSVTREQGTHHFHRLIASAMTA